MVAEHAAIESAESERFWLDKVSDRPDCRLPRWRLRREVAEPGQLETLLPAELCDRVVALASRCGVPVGSVVLAAHLRVMSLVTGGADLLVGLSGVPLRVRLPQGSWLGLITAASDAERELRPHLGYPLDVIQGKLGGDPLFEVNFGYDQAPGAGPAEAASFPLNVRVIRSPDSGLLLLAIEYQAGVLAAEQVLRLRGYYLTVFEAMTADPRAAHHLAPLLGDAERALMASWNDTAAEVPPVLVHQMVQARAAASPDAVAVVTESRSLTYGQLNARANRLAWWLRDLGVGPDVAVGLCLERSLEMVVALLAIAKAGGIYVPLDAAFPADRLAFMLGQVGAKIVLTHDNTCVRLPGGPWRAINLDTDAPPRRAPAADLPELVTGDNACYIIFTSGSTGQPKGVMTLHRNVTELVYGGDCVTLTPADTLLQLAPLPFDNSTFELWATLTAGARLVLAPAGRYTPSDIAGWVTGHDVTVLHVTASFFALLVDHEPQLFDQLRRFLTGSETVSPRHTAQILDRCPELEIVNCWGPTETTTFSVCGTFTRGTLPDGPLPLGTPLANTEVWVLDQAGQPAPVGTPGELYVAGPCLARGYLGNPVLTADRFAPHPYGAPGSRLYRTGDRGRWSPDGRVDFLGRVDHMVKIRGYRIELGEVEAALERSPDVRQAKVIAAPGPDGNPELRAFAAAAAGSRPGATGLRAHLESLLPRYMLPGSITVLDELPVTRNGKIDGKALLALPRAGSRGGKPRPPQTPMQQEVAAIWAEVLQTGVADLADDFFLLGGNQDLALRVLVLLQERLLVQIPLAILIRTTKLEAFSALVEKAFTELAGELDLGALIVEQTDGVKP